MALPSSGAISLNAMHVEVDGTSETQVSINDSDIRGLIDKASGAQMAFNEWYGAANIVTESNFNYSPNGTWYIYYAGYPAYIYWNGTAVVSNVTIHQNFGALNTAYAFNQYQEWYDPCNSRRIKANVPFPAHSGTIGGWRYFAKRLECAQGMTLNFTAHRTTSTTYPY